MPVEILALAVAVWWVCTYLYAAAREEKKRKMPPAPAVPVAQAPRRPEPILAVPGTVPLAGPDRSFLRQFGIAPWQAADIRLYRGPGALDTFPGPVRRLLEASYGNGYGRGPELAATIFRNRALGENESVYFVLLRTPTNSIASFVDRTR